MDDQVTIRPLETVAEFQATHAVQKAAWGFSDLLVIPYRQLITFQQHGGVVLGAFRGPELVGLVVGYLGRRNDGPLYLFSQRMGVAPAYQGQGIGERLKWGQRAWAVAHGLDRIVWTYDPLEARNAWLNVTKLGAVVRCYECDLFGPQDQACQPHLPSDRFVLEWELHSEPVLARLLRGWSPPTHGALLAQADTVLNYVTWDEQQLPHCGSVKLERTDPALLAEVPGNWGAICQADPPLALDWRLKTRVLFEHYLERGYAVSRYASGCFEERRRSFYLLEKETAGPCP
jgi:predicted GNAT superfamily acetyltransferase